MGKQRKSRAAAIPAILVVMAALLGLYVGGYYWLGHYYPNSLVIGTRTISVRLFPYEWVQKLYMPAAKAESLLSNREVLAGCYYYGGHPELPE